MPWQERTPMERRRQFIEDWLTELWTMSELCAAYDVSRKTGYQLLKRFGAEGWAAVVERSRRPHRTPPPIPAEVVARVLMLRERHPRWGARKLRGRLLRREPTVAWPSQTAIHRLLHQAALVGEAPKRRALPSVRSGRLRRADAPNDVWTVDFQGDFRLGSAYQSAPENGGAARKGPRRVVGHGARSVRRADAELHRSRHVRHPGRHQARPEDPDRLRR